MTKIPLYLLAAFALFCASTPDAVYPIPTDTVLKEYPAEDADPVGQIFEPCYCRDGSPGFAFVCLNADDDDYTGDLDGWYREENQLNS